MIRKMVCAAFVMTVVIGLAVADDFTATITKVDGNNVTYQKYKKGKKGAKGEKDGDPVTIAVAKDAKVAKGMFDKDAKKFVAGDAIEGGLKSDVLAKASEDKGVNCFLTTDADNKSVTQILVIMGKKGK
jgi:hypothetical protein